MARNCLLLHHDYILGGEIVEALNEGGLEAAQADNVNDAIRKIARGGVDILIVDAALPSPKATDFLAKAREKAPRLLRALLTDEMGNIDPDKAINQAGVCAVLRRPVTSAQVLELIDEFAPPPPPPPAPVVDEGEVASLKERVTELEKKLKKSDRDLAIARGADKILREDELDVASLQAQKMGSELGSEIEIDFQASRIVLDGTAFPFAPLSATAQELIVAEGAENLVRSRLAAAPA